MNKQCCPHSAQPTHRRWRCSVPCGACFAARAAAKRSKSEELPPESPQGDLIAAKRSSDATPTDAPQPDARCVYVARGFCTLHTVSQRRPCRKRGDGNTRIIGLSLLGALPVAAVQGVVAWMSRMVSSAGWDSDPSSPGHYFFSPYDWGVGAQCPDQLQNQGCVQRHVCAFMTVLFTIGVCCVSSQQQALSRRVFSRCCTAPGWCGALGKCRATSSIGACRNDFACFR